MKKKLYTIIDNNYSDIINNNDLIFNSQEHADISELKYKDKSLNSREKVIQDSLNNNLRKKFKPLQFLTDRIEEKNYKNILSLGCGIGDIEYFLYLSLDNNKNLYAGEFDSYLVKKSNQFFPEYKTFEFDFYKDSFKDLNYKFDIVFAFGAFYVMDDDNFIQLLKDIKSSGVKEIIDFHAGYIKKIDKLNYLRKDFLKIFNFFNSDDNTLLNKKFHGFARDSDELIRLYNKAGWDSINVVRNNGIYKFTAILN